MPSQEADIEPATNNGVNMTLNSTSSHDDTPTNLFRAGDDVESSIPRCKLLWLVD